MHHHEAGRYWSRSDSQPLSFPTSPTYRVQGESLSPIWHKACVWVCTLTSAGCKIFAIKAPIARLCSCCSVRGGLGHLKRPSTGSRLEFLIGEWPGGTVAGRGGGRCPVTRRTRLCGVLAASPDLESQARNVRIGVLGVFWWKCPSTLILIKRLCSLPLPGKPRCHDCGAADTSFSSYVGQANLAEHTPGPHVLRGPK